MKITIIYDNTARDRRLGADWGFSCLLETVDKKILFDTGANGSLLINNMKYLGIKPADITDIFISHDHWDHTGGLQIFTSVAGGTCFIPENFSQETDIPTVRIGKAPQEIYDNIWSTGTLDGLEQSLAIKQSDQVVVITGCSHPGVELILDVAGTIGKVTALIGGLHGFDNIDALDGLSLVCPTHCTQHIEDIRRRLPQIYKEGGAGSIVEF